MSVQSVSLYKRPGNIIAINFLSIFRASYSAVIMVQERYIRKVCVEHSNNLNFNSPTITSLLAPSSADVLTSRPSPYTCVDL